MATLRTYSWYIQGFIKKYNKVLLGSTVGGVFLFLILPNLFSILPALKPTTYVGRVGKFALSGLPRDIQEKVSYGLMRVDNNGQVTPALAASYVVEENGKAYRFTLKKDIRWQDGTLVVPQDVSYAFSDTEVARSQNDIVYRLTAKKQEESTQEPVLPVSFLSTVSQPLFKKIEQRRWFFSKSSQIIGLGNYRITALRYQGNSIDLLTIESDKERLIYRFYPTEHEAIVAFKHGSVDRLESFQGLEDLAQWQSVGKQLVRHNDQYVGIFFNLAYRSGEMQPFASRSLRQALNYALQKPQGDERILSPIHKDSWAYVSSDEDIDRFEQDMTTAVDDLIKAETPVPLTIELTTVPAYKQKAEEIKQSWEQLGTLAFEKCTSEGSTSADVCKNKEIKVLVKIANVPDLSNFQALLIGQQIPPDPDQYTFWHSTQSTNFTHYKNAQVDKLLEDGRRLQSREERKLLYQEFQRIVVRDVPTIFLEPTVTYNAWRK